MKITFIGTGAADWNWHDYPLGTRGSTSTLIGSTILIDAGPTVLINLRRFGADISRIAHLVVTHSHPDHFRPDVIASIAALTKGKLTVWAAPEALAKLDGIACVRRPVTAGMDFKCGTVQFTALPSNHSVENLAEGTFHYLIRSGKAALLYAIDGAWMMGRAKHMITRTLQGAPLTAVIWDATCGKCFHNYRFAEHNDLQMIADLRAPLLDAQIISEKTLHIFDHIAQSLWPETDAERAAVAADYSGLLAEDGDTLLLK